MIDKIKLRNFLEYTNRDATMRSTQTGGAEHYYEVGRSAAISKLLVLLDSAKFDIQEVATDETSK